MIWLEVNPDQCIVPPPGSRFGDFTVGTNWFV